MRELALFAGAGGGILGGKLLGWKCVCAVEIDSYARKVLLARQADGCLEPFPIWDDVTTFDGYPWRGRVDVVSGGFPCQDISSAGRGAGIDGKRSGLWAEFARIIGEVQPTYAWVENSPILTSRGLDRVLWDLAALGYDARWGVLGAKHAGGPINRDRLWVCAGPCQEYGGRVPRWPYPVKRDMEDDKQARSLVDRYLEELDRAGEQRKDQVESDIPPYLLRMVDGVADELDEIKAIGNGQVPAVVALAWRILTMGLAINAHQAR